MTDLNTPFVSLALVVPRLSLLFYHLHSLAAQDCACKGHLTDLEILGLEQTQVGRHHVSGAQDDLGKEADIEKNLHRASMTVSCT